MAGPRYCYGGKRVEAIRKGMRTRQMNRLAKLVSEGAQIQHAGRQLGLSKTMTRKTWQAIKQDLGPQAYG